MELDTITSSSNSSRKKYLRGGGFGKKKNERPDILTHVRRKRIIKKDEKIQKGLEHAVNTQILLLEERGGIQADVGEHTLTLKQHDIRKQVDISTATKNFHLNLDKFGPYYLDYTPNGRHMLLAGNRGHVATFDWVTKSLHCEFNVMESIHDITWLHNENMFAVAQKNWTFVYDNEGIEIHCLKALDQIQSLDFLPYHFLLVGGHKTGYISWVDVSIGKIVSQFGTKKGSLHVMTTNPYNAVTCCGHSNGTVTFWSPSVKSPLASILCHGTPLSAIAVDNVGRLMATGGKDGTLRVWDLRNSFTPLSSVKIGVANKIDFSETGFLSVATSNQALVFSEIQHKQKPYLKHVTAGNVSSIQFCPFEDVLGVGSQYGFDSVIIPGSGEANFDALERNPYETKKQRREVEVRSLLEKIQPELISLDNSILGEVNTTKIEESIAKKPVFFKKADIELNHRKKRKSATLPKIKQSLQSELKLKSIRQIHQNSKIEEMAKSDKNSNHKKTYFNDNDDDDEVGVKDPLARFTKKKKPKSD